MTHDPDVQRAIDAAAQELARRLRPWIAGMADLDTFAVRFIEDLHKRGWRPIPRSDRIPDQGRKDPAAYKRGADLARKALRDALTEGEPS